MASLIDEHTQFQDEAGQPIVNGKIYIGTQNLDPVTNPITIYSDRGLTTTISNPQATDANGRAVNKIWVPGTYSIRVDDSSDVQQYQELDAGTSADSDINAKVSSNDTTTGYLNGKLVAGTNVTLTEQNNGSNETLEISGGTAGLLIAESADHNNAPAATFGEIWIKNDAPNRLQFTDDAGNDFLISPLVQQTDHTRVGHHQYYSGTGAPATYTFDAATNVTQATWESIGPTGSGADNIWTGLDLIPSGASGVMLGITGVVDGSATGDSFLKVHLRPTGSSQTNNDMNQVVFANADNVADTPGGMHAVIDFPLDSSLTFELYWDESNATTQNVTVMYRGFITS